MGSEQALPWRTRTLPDRRFWEATPHPVLRVEHGAVRERSCGEVAPVRPWVCTLPSVGLTWPPLGPQGCGRV